MEDWRVPKSQVLGEVGKGWELSQSWLGTRGCRVGIRSHGMSQRVLRAVAHGFRHDSEETERAASTIGFFLGELEALRTLTYLGAWKADQKLDVRTEAADVKLSATELLHEVIDFAV